MRAWGWAAAMAGAALLFAGGAQARIVHDGGCPSGYALVNGAQRTCLQPERIVHDARCNGPAVVDGGAVQCLASSDRPSSSRDPAPLTPDDELDHAPDGLDRVSRNRLAPTPPPPPKPMRIVHDAGCLTEIKDDAANACVSPDRIVHDGVCQSNQAVVSPGEAACVPPAVMGNVVTSRKHGNLGGSARCRMTGVADGFGACADRLVFASHCPRPAQAAALFKLVAVCLPGDWATRRATRARYHPHHRAGRGRF
jgi:hypothetical protein